MRQRRLLGHFPEPDPAELIVAASAAIARWLVRKNAAHHELPEGEVICNCN